MKKLIVFVSLAVFSVNIMPLNLYAQTKAAETAESSAAAEPTAEEKAAQEAFAAQQAAEKEYNDSKADLDLQLQKLTKDRDVAKRDKNTSLEKKRNSEISDTKKQLQTLEKDYKAKTNPASEETATKAATVKKASSDVKMDPKFYDNELKKELKKMNAEDGVSSDGESQPAPKKKTTTTKKKK